MIREISESIQEELIKKNIVTFIDVAGKTAEYPYIVISLTERERDGDKHQYDLSLDGWDQKESYNRSISMIETAAAELDYMSVATSQQSFFCMIYDDGNLNKVEDQDKRLKHVTKTMQIQAYERSK